jgi:tetratricopeptide (TPR) repeat protein
LENYSDFEKVIPEITELMTSKRFDEVAQIFRHMEGLKLPVNLLVAKATAIQLANEPAGYELDDARNSLLKAVSLDPGYIDGWVELGHFYFALDDNPRAALTCFEFALPRVKNQYKNLVLATARALAELGKTDEAIEFLDSQSPEREVIELTHELSQKE